MSLEDLGNIGELIAAIGVIASLIYLAVQIRQNTRSLRLSTHHTIATRSSELNRSVAENADLARITGIGNQDRSQLTPDECRQFNSYCLTRFRHYEDLHYQYTQGMLAESYWNGFRRFLSSYVGQQPGILVFWAENKEAFGDEFIAYYDSLLETDQAKTKE